MKTTIRAVFSGTISTGAYENEKPLFEICEEYDGDFIPEEVKAEVQRNLYAICKDNFIRIQRLSIEDRVKLENEGIRLYPVAEKNMDYPSVTSITGWDKDFNMPDVELAQYGSRGTLVHARCEHYDNFDNNWIELEDLVKTYPDLYKDYVIMRKGNRNLNADGYDYPAFLKKYPIEHLKSEMIVYNHELEYAGRADKTGVPILNDAWKKLGAQAIETVFDFKTSKVIDETYHAQISAYAKPLGVKQAVIISLKNYKDIKQGFSTPVVVDLTKSFPKFVEARKIFRKRFGI